MQWPLAHTSALEQAWPFGYFGTHTLPEQKCPVEHSVFEVHSVAQAVGPHTYGAHATVTGSGHVAAVPVQVAACVAVPAAQLAARQGVPADAKASGQSLETPSHVSATSHIPAELRQTSEFDRLASSQVVDTPSQ